MIKTGLLQSPALRSAGRFAFITALIINAVSLASISFAVEENTATSGTFVGSWCYRDSGGDAAVYEKCALYFCHQRPTGAEAAECKRKADAERDRLAAEQYLI